MRNRITKKLNEIANPSNVRYFQQCIRKRPKITSFYNGYQQKVYKINKNVSISRYTDKNN